MTIKADPKDAGCWIGSSYGIYGSTMLLVIADNWDYAMSTEVTQARLKAYYAMVFPNAEKPTDEEWEIISEAAEKAEEWMNENIAPEGHYFEWHEGEFFLSKIEEETDDETDTPTSDS